jgi:threonine-phosphate decarboxylase
MIRGVPAHGGQMRALVARLGVDPHGLLDFSANINPEGPPAGVVAALRAALDRDEVIGEYPDLEERELRGAIALHAGIATEQVVVANGVIPLLEATLRARRVERCLLPVPAFSEYRSTLERVGVAVTPYVLSAGDGFRYRREGLLEALTSGGHDALLLANPQNPSGAVCGREGMLELIEEAGRLGVRVLLDEAFIDYAPSHSLSGDVERMPHLTVFRSLTKFYGVPGLRVAYALAHEAQAREIGGQVAAWAVTTLAGIGVRAALADREYVERTLTLNEGRRERLVRGLDELGIASYAAAANFLLLRLPDGMNASACWERLIVEHGIVLRDCSNFEALPGGHLRCLVRGDAENERLLRALRKVLS